VVVFQPELRRALMRLGETRLFRSFSTQLNDDIDALVESATSSPARKIGATRRRGDQRDVRLGGIAETGTPLNADLTAELLNTIFLAQLSPARPRRGRLQRSRHLRRRSIPTRRIRRP